MDYSGFDYGVSDVAKIVSDFKDMTETFGSKNKLGAMSIGIPVWSIEPMAGVYFEFSEYLENGEYKGMFTGGGGYIGVIGSFRYTYYMIIMGVPVYVGGDVSLTLVGEFGVAPDAFFIELAEIGIVGLTHSRDDALDHLVRV